LNTPRANPAESAARSFLTALFANKPATAYILIWTLRGEVKRSRWFLDVNLAAPYVESVSGCNIYVGIGLSPSDFGEFNRCDSENVAGLIGLGADIDLSSDAHPKGARPTTIEQALSILPPKLPPTIVIETGNGLQGWWLFKEPWIFKDAAERQQAAALSSRWQTLLKYNAHKHGWAFERLKDLARVLRIPGTQNVKDPANPKDVTIRSFTNHRYNPSDFSAYLDDLAIPDEDEKARAAKALAEHLTAETLVIELAAAAPAEQLARWMEQDPRFRSTWDHQRADMPDKSQSGYDMALACFGVRNGLSDQQIIDLIIHNRRVHGAKQSKRLDYYHRAISKARNGTGRLPADDPAAPTPARPPLSCAITGAPTERTITGGAADPNQKAKLCEKISAIVGVPIFRIVKLVSQEPVFLMEFEEGGCIQFPDAGKLISQRFFKTALAGKAGKLLRKFHAREWEQFAQMMLDACTVCEGTDDLELKGAAQMYIDQYLAAFPPLASLENQSKENLFNPVIDKGHVAISSTHLQLSINKLTSQNLSVIKVAAMIASIGGKAVRLRRHGLSEQSRWALPVEKFDPKDYPQQDGEDDGDGE
jgi:hypothetical protein